MTEQEKIQNRCVELSDTYNNLLLTLSTGVGKSLAAIKIIAKHRGNGYLIVNETPHIDNWINEFKKHGYEYLLDNITIFCYASLKNYINNTVDFIIYDEVHHLPAPTYIKNAQTITATRIIGLSATVSKDDKAVLNETLGDFYEYHISLTKAISLGILPKPNIYLIALELDDLIIGHKYIISKGQKSKRKKFECIYGDFRKFLYKYNDLELTINCTARQKYNLITSLMDEARNKYFQLENERIDKDLDESFSKWAKFRWLQFGSIRKRFLADQKDTLAKELIQMLINKRLIVFSGSVLQANRLALDEKYVVNSHKSKKANSGIINQFNDKKISKLFATGMLKEGMNLEDIEATIVVQLSNQLREFLQVLGRTLRAYNPEHYIIYIKNTQDITYLSTALKGIDLKYVYKINNLNELE